LPLIKESGRRLERDIRTSYGLLGEDPQDDWVLKGPRSMRHVLRFCLDQGGDPSGRVGQFMVLAGLSYADTHMTEYAVIMKVIEFGIKVDNLKVTNLQSFELLARRAQLIEEKYKYAMPHVVRGALDPEANAGLMLGLGTHALEGRSALIVMPALSEYVGEELAKEAAITKGVVKAHELRLQAIALQSGRGAGRGRRTPKNPSGKEGE
jgi:hypothetical protein